VFEKDNQSNKYPNLLKCLVPDSKQYFGPQIMNTCIPYSNHIPKPNKIHHMAVTPWAEAPNDGTNDSLKIQRIICDQSLQFSPIF
jgi:hypothetical protein